MTICNILARVALVDYRGQVLYDAFVQPTSPVESYRSATTGLKRTDFNGGGCDAILQRVLFHLPNLALPFDEVQAAVSRLIRNRVIVGHQLWSDLQVGSCCRGPGRSN